MLRLSLSALLLTLSASLAAAETLMVHDAYVRAVPPGTPNSAAFMSIHNAADGDHALVSAASPAAKVVELHTHTMEDGMMKMRRIEKIDLPAGKRVSLEPGGLHVMLIGLTQPLKEGDKVDLTLRFDDGSEQRVSAPVKSVLAGMQGMDHQHQH
jgi:copper(I)-binding protein